MVSAGRRRSWAEASWCTTPVVSASSKTAERVRQVSRDVRSTLLNVMFTIQSHPYTESQPPQMIAHVVVLEVVAQPEAGGDAADRRRHGRSSQSVVTGTGAAAGGSGHPWVGLTGIRVRASRVCQAPRSPRNRVPEADAIESADGEGGFSVRRSAPFTPARSTHPRRACEGSACRRGAGRDGERRARWRGSCTPFRRGVPASRSGPRPRGHPHPR